MPKRKPDDSPAPVPDLDRAIAHALAEDEGEQVMVTSYIVVVEYLSASGTICVTTLTDGETPMHRHHGLLFAADLYEDDYADDFADDEDD